MPITDKHNWQGAGYTQMNVNEHRMLGLFERLNDYIYTHYHMHPTHLPHVELTEAEKAEMVEADAMGRSLAAIMDQTAGGKKLKKVILYGDRKHSNGLPRRDYGTVQAYHAPNDGLIGNGMFVLIMLAMAGLIGLLVYLMW